jgi:uncharacterized membrane protein
MADAAENEAIAEVESAAAERLTFFSDAVVAIAMTLLALDLPLPRGATAEEFWRSAGQNFGFYLAFVLSFLVIARHWLSHHSLFRWVVRTDNRLRTLDLIWLFFIVLMPFVTRIIAEGWGEGDDGTTPIRFAIYAASQVLIDVVYIAILLHLKNRGLLRADSPPALIPDGVWGGGGIAVGFGLSIPLFFVTDYAWVLWIVVPLAMGLTHDRRRRSAPAA